MFTIWSIYSMLILLLLSYYSNISHCLTLWGKLLHVVFFLNCKSHSNLSVIQLASSFHCFSFQSCLWSWFTLHMSQIVQVSVNVSISILICKISQAHCSLQILLFKFGCFFQLVTVTKLHTDVWTSYFVKWWMIAELGWFTQSFIGCCVWLETWYKT
jgi:hypothetical protein